MNFRREFVFTITLLLLMYASSFFIPLVKAEKGTKILYPIEDTYVSGSNYFANFGSEEELNIADYITQQIAPGGLERVFHVALLKFDLTSQSSSLQLLSVELYLYCVTIEGSPVTIQAFHCESNAWDENTLHHLYYAENILPYLCENGSNEVTVDIQNTWYSTNITEGFINFVEGTLTECIRIGPNMLGKSIDFSSKEGVYSPYLEITYEKSASSLTCRLSQDTIALGNTVVLTGELVPIIDDANITLFYQNNETIIEKFVLTDSMGAYFTTFKPTTDGLWTVTAEWPGTDYYSSTSVTVFINATSVSEEPEIPEEPTQQNNLSAAFMISMVIGSLAIIAIVPFIISRKSV